MPPIILLSQTPSQFCELLKRNVDGAMTDEQFRKFAKEFLATVRKTDFHDVSGGTLKLEIKYARSKLKELETEERIRKSLGAGAEPC